jgi:hypothetical protein
MSSRIKHHFTLGSKFLNSTNFITIVAGQIFNFKDIWHVNRSQWSDQSAKKIFEIGQPVAKI